MARRKAPELRPTLGPLVCDWIEEYLVHGPGDIQGEPIELDDEVRSLIWRAYEIYPRDHALAGRRVFRRVVFSRPKGRAKSEVAGMIAVAEGLAEVRFDGWDAKGNPVGAPITSPVVRCFATAEDQAGNTFDNALFMVENGSVYDAYAGLDPGITRINLPDGGSIVSTTSAASSKDGGKDTFDVFDETHLWTSARLKSLHATVTRNLVKRRLADGWAFETSTMYGPGEGSVAEDTHQSARDVDSVLFDHREAPLATDITDDDQLRDALRYVYGSAADWTNIESIISDEFRNPLKRESECRRYWLNQPWSSEEKFITPVDWDACLDISTTPPSPIPNGDEVVLAFDGSFSGDSTGIVAISTDETPHIQVVGCWERPEGPEGNGWRVPRLDVMETIRAAARRWRVVEATADPYGWRQSLEELDDEGIAITEYPQSGARMIPATKRFYDLIMGQGLTHDGDERLRRHVLNAVLKTDARGSRLSKESKNSLHKIDLAVCAVMGLDRAADHIGTPEIHDLNEVVERLRRERQPA